MKASRIRAGIELGIRISHARVDNSFSTPQHPEQIWINQSRQLWLNETTTVLATTEESFNEALTLSLDQGIEDTQSFGPWIKRLLLHSSSSSTPSWSILCLRDEDRITEKEIRNSQKFHELAQYLDLSLHALYIINHTQYWRITFELNDEGHFETHIAEGK